MEHRWSAQDHASADSVPYVGRSPRMAHTLVATGFKKWGLSNGTAAAMVLADVVAGRDDPWLTVLDATRIGGAHTVKKLVEEAAPPGPWPGRDRRGRRPDRRRLPGREGRLHAVSLTCRHMACSLHWNRAETSWDCPCHGPRYSNTGRLLNGPAVEDLPRIEANQQR